MMIPQLLPRSLLGRSLIIIVGPLILLQAVSAFAFYDRHWRTISTRLGEGIVGDIGAVLELLANDPSASGHAFTITLARARFGLDVGFHPGKIRPESIATAESKLEEILAKALTNRIGLPFAIDLDQPEVSIELQTGDEVTRFIFSRRRLDSANVQILVMWMVGTGAALALVAILFMRNQIRPIRNLAEAAEEFGKGRDVTDFRVAGAIEVRQAAAAFLSMRDRIRRQISQRTQMLNGVSHDLRTPLTRMKLQLAMMGDSPEIADLKTDVDEMDRMIEGYLAFARGEGTEAPRPTAVTPLLQEVVHGARRNGTTIDLHVENDIELPLRPDAFRRSVANLVANAARYGQHVAVRASVRAGSLEITVDDDGPGVAPELREDVFRPFFRLDEARNSATGGTGLGLTIARDVIRRHGGDVTLEDSPIGGLRARVRLPL
ncbi:MAG: HAMP domain-containing protein [Alphaproteobacteria bacterium]|nr:HAMP domain-containing protein [Alphaproteobacteria bacterium]